ncbi:G-type lectin S-receptor-like serine/threonine-protein kinase At2g19130 [Cryptomeria japonica]|uniref:G-type lectin S-receptor-like serine/threonine-protein kinase At2g19130 n=1 Tax=Cryptomeria japonica TaxID=3369 RepID=UPI0025ACAFBD|nr:G-type lectin S-receptor-like serine/threonine-protein kinase At2g19130 [Cryptomeria japonica]
MKIVTRNFGSLLGSGGFGSVFKGTLTDGTLVAVKKLDHSREDEKQFRAEIGSLGNIQHVNFVSLGGFCAEGSQRLLVYDYMPNGSLNSLLFSSNNQSKRKHIIQNDVKPENILLDSEFSPMLADFGIAKNAESTLFRMMLSRVLTTTRGTSGYLAPEWLWGLPITPKGNTIDIVEEGVLLAEKADIEEARRAIVVWVAMH